MQEYLVFMSERNKNLSTSCAYFELSCLDNIMGEIKTNPTPKARGSVGFVLPKA
jgi:hypothetical protein